MNTVGVSAESLSIVIPAFNEERRLSPTVAATLHYLRGMPLSWEIIVVDDGSRDKTADIVASLSAGEPRIRLIQLGRNRGKGAAVRTGMLAAQNSLVLFADADGSTPFAEIERLLQAITIGADVAFGSRALFANDTSVETSWYRKYPGRIFSACVRALALPGIADTQCGFKLFRRNAAQAIFSRQTADGFSFDVEVLLIARKLGYHLSEVPINWRNMPGSKVNMLTDSLKMLCDVATFRFIHRRLAPAPVH